MTPTTPASGLHEPSLRTVEMVCERLGELGLPVGPDTARELARSVLTSEAPRVDARVREAIQTALDTIRIAAQSAIGVLGSTSPVELGAAPPDTHQPVLDPPPRRAAAAVTPTPRPRPRPAKRNSGAEPGDDIGGERRPVFRRPRGR